MNFDILEDYKNYIGMVLFAISILLILYLFLNPAMGYFLSVDEQFTLAVLNHSFSDAWKLIVNDVHPPLYYLILMGFKQLFNMLHVSLDLLYMTKLVSLVPLIILVIIAVTKIRRDYGWLSCGVFLFGITAMANCSEIYITGRMYSWCVLFMILAFLSYMRVLKSSNITSWILLCVFTILCAYTHYILLFSLFVMYLTYLVYIEFNDRVDKKTELKKLIALIVACIICYLPWILSLTSQVSTVNRTFFNGAKLSVELIINYLTCFILQDTKHLTDLIFWKFLVVLLAILLVIMFIKEIDRFKDYEAFSIFSGLNIYVFTILIASFFVTFIFKAITVRYFVAAAAVLWLSIAILVSKVKNYKLLLVILILILTLGSHGIITTVKDVNYHNNLDLEQKNVIANINNQDNVVIYNGTYTTYHHLLNNTKEYSLKPESVLDNPTYTYEEDMSWIIEDNPDKNIYLITGLTNISDDDVEYDDGITAKKLSRQGRIWIMQLTQEVTDEENTTENATEVTQ